MFKFLGLWFLQRRKLLPFLMVSGITILFFITATVWLGICLQGLSKFKALIPSGLGLLLLYWWMLINRLLEDIHEGKIAEIASVANFGVTETHCGTGMSLGLENGELKELRKLNRQITIV